MYMKTSKRFFFSILFSTIFICTRGFAQSGIEPYKVERVGQSGWQFLKINGDARTAALGDSYAALANDGANAVFGNPASLNDIENINAVFNKTNWIADIGYQSVSVVKNFPDIGYVGLSIASIDYGDIPETINSPVAGETTTEALVTGRTFSASDVALGVTFSRNITDHLTIGGNVRWLKETIADVSMTNWSLDLGTLFYTGFRSLRIGFVARNFGPDSHLVGYNEALKSEAVDIRMPIDFRIGIAMDFFDDPGSKNILTVSIDGNHPNDGPEKFHAGLEYVFDKMLFIRGGYKFNYDEESYTLGLGLNYSLAGYRVKFNYAYIDFGILQQVHMFTISLDF